MLRRLDSCRTDPGAPFAVRTWIRFLRAVRSSGRTLWCRRHRTRSCWAQRLIRIVALILAVSHFGWRKGEEEGSQTISSLGTLTTQTSPSLTPREPNLVYQFKPVSKSVQNQFKIFLNSSHFKIFFCWPKIFLLKSRLSQLSNALSPMYLSQKLAEIHSFKLMFRWGIHVYFLTSFRVWCVYKV